MSREIEDGIGGEAEADAIDLIQAAGRYPVSQVNYMFNSFRTVLRAVLSATQVSVTGSFELAVARLSLSR